MLEFWITLDFLQHCDLIYLLLNYKSHDQYFQYYFGLKDPNMLAIIQLQQETSRETNSQVNENSKAQSLSLSFEEIQNMFSGEYQQESHTLTRVPYRTINTENPCVVPYRLKSCNKLGCLFDKQKLKPQQEVHCCNQKVKYKYQELILDWRLYGLVHEAVKKNVFDQQDKIQIILHNNRLALINLTKSLYAYQPVWKNSGYNQSLQQTKNIIKDILKDEIYSLLRKKKVSKNLIEIKYFLNQIKYSRLAQVGQKISDSKLIATDFNPSQKKCLFYFDYQGQKSYLYYFQKQQQSNQYSFLVPYQIKHSEGRNGASLQGSKWFKNNRGILHSLGSDQWIYRYVLSANKNFVEQKYVCDKKLAQIQKSTQLVYVADKNILYLIGGQKNCFLSYINFQKVPENNSCLIEIKFRQQLAINECKALYAGNKQIYIVKTDQPQSEIVTVYCFNPSKQNEVQIIKMGLENSKRHMLVDPQGFLTSVLDNGEPSILFIAPSLENGVPTTRALIWNLSKQKNTYKQFQDCKIKLNCQPLITLDTQKQSLINDYAGMILINSSSYLMKLASNFEYQINKNQQSKLKLQVCQVAIFIKEKTVHIKKITF